jgi:pimeloyl-ACP methyl ester carboxylesterase
VRASPFLPYAAYAGSLGADRRPEYFLASLWHIRENRASSAMLWGEHDATLPVAVGQRLQAHRPRAAFRVIAGAGHQPMWDHSPAFNQVVVPFLGGGKTPTPL